MGAGASVSRRQWETVDSQNQETAHEDSQSLHVKDMAGMAKLMEAKNKFMKNKKKNAACFQKEVIPLRSFLLLSLPCGVFFSRAMASLVVAVLYTSIGLVLSTTKFSLLRWFVILQVAQFCVHFFIVLLVSFPTKNFGNGYSNFEPSHPSHSNPEKIKESVWVHVYVCGGRGDNPGCS